MERAGGLNEQHRQGGLSYFPDTTSNAAKESQKDTKETSSSSKGNNDTIRGVATYFYSTDCESWVQSDYSLVKSNLNYLHIHNVEKKFFRQINLE